MICEFIKIVHWACSEGIVGAGYTMFVLRWLLVVLCSWSTLSMDCEKNENCAIHMWMAWQSCSGTCGSQTQIRQRQLCCPKAVLEKTVLNCLQACQMDISTTKLNESRPCVLCKNWSLSSLNSCHCDAKSKGLCCEGIFQKCFHCLSFCLSRTYFLFLLINSYV